MSEINNIGNYGLNIDKIDKKNIKRSAETSAHQEDIKEKEYVPDTGILGRSQVKTTKGADISKSVDEAVNMAKRHSTLMQCSEKIFNYVYQSYLDKGLSPSQAYEKALLAEEEFMEISGSKSA